MTDPGESNSAAVLSECGRYRYALTRGDWLAGEGTVLFVMLNPSTADARTDDATIRRCIGFAQRWGYARLTVANLFAFRATNPAALLRVEDPVGPENDEWIARLAGRATEAIVAWGAHRAALERERHVLALVEHYCGTARCLGQTKALAPHHPLRLRNDTRRVIFRREAVIA